MHLSELIEARRAEFDFFQQQYQLNHTAQAAVERLRALHPDHVPNVEDGPQAASRPWVLNHTMADNGTYERGSVVAASAARLHDDDSESEPSEDTVGQEIGRRAKKPLQSSSVVTAGS